MTNIDGFIEPGFEEVAKEFENNFTLRQDIGAAVAVYLDGKPVVDLWGGLANKDTKDPWKKDTMVLVFSTTKGITSILANLLIQQNKLDPEQEVSEIWPEYAQNNKDKTKVKWVLSHKAGLPYIENRHEMPEVMLWNPIIESLAKQAPLWEPGTAHGYHALTFGWLNGEIIRRAYKAKDFSLVFTELLQKPLNLNTYIKLPEDLDKSVAKLEVIEPPKDPELLKIYNAFVGPDTLTGKALATPVPALEDIHVWNSLEIRRSIIPSANAISDARSLAKLYSATVTETDSVKLFNDDQIKLMTEPQTHGNDRILIFPTSFGLGFMLPGQFSLYAHPGSFGHDGAGGSVAFCDPEKKLAFAYVMNKMQASLNGDPRSRSLIDATYKALNEKTPQEFFK
jgi:CubicO group peptidase (beta-lactamase class C family)